jgi:hypothetical protein
MKTMLGARATTTTGAAAAAKGGAARAPSSLLLSRGRLLVANVAVPSRPPTAHTARRSKVEIIKEQSDYLRHPLMEVRFLAVVGVLRVSFLFGPFFLSSFRAPQAGTSR